MHVLIQARRLARYIQGCGDFILLAYERQPYDHMGAVIVDAMLQAGLNYRAVVEPRVKHIYSNFPNAATTSGFYQLILTTGTSNLIGWTHPEKPMRIEILTDALLSEGVDTINDLRAFMHSMRGPELLRNLRGIGPKTVDYIKMLIGIPSIPVDRHIRNFVTLSGLNVSEYSDIGRIVAFSADLLEVGRNDLDYSIWRYMAAGFDSNGARSMNSAARMELQSALP